MLLAKQLFLKNVGLKIYEDKLMFALMNNKTNNFLFSEEEWFYLISNADLNAYATDGSTALMVAFCCNKSEELCLGEKNWDLLIKGTNIYQRKFWSRSSVVDIALARFESQDLHIITTEQWGYMLSKTDLNLISNIGECVALQMLDLPAVGGFTDVLRDYVMDSIDLDLMKDYLPIGAENEYLRLLSVKERFLFKKTACIIEGSHSLLKI